MIVYSTITEKEVRGIGKDAIRVVAIYENEKGERKPLGKADKRINRVGQIEDILMRVKSRIKEVQEKVDKQGLCGCCGAPMFESKRGNVVCVEACWVGKQTSQPQEIDQKSYEELIDCLFMEG